MAPKNGKNVRNPASPLFKRLTRLFSGPITQRRTQQGRALRRRHLDTYASRFKSASGKQFKKQEFKFIILLGVHKRFKFFRSNWMF